MGEEATLWAAMSAVANTRCVLMRKTGKESRREGGQD